MKDNDQGRFIRWGIPGWMMFLSLFCFWIIDIIFTHDSEKNLIFNLIKDLFTSEITSTSSAAIGALIIAAAGIPLGFLIYQLYFYVRWNSPFSRDGFFPPFVVGRWQDLNRTMDGITDRQISEGIPWRKKWISNTEYKKDHSGRWRYVENYFIEILGKYTNNQSSIDLYARYRYLLELLHTLGAGLFGMYIGYILYLFTKVKIYSFSLTIMLLIWFVSLAISIVLLELEDKFIKIKKRDEEKSKVDSLINRLLKKYPWLRGINFSVIYLFFCGVFLYLGSPSTSPSANLYGVLYYRIIILLVPIIIWFLTKNREILKLRVTETIFLLMGGGFFAWFAIVLRVKFSSEEWTFGWVTYSFLILNTVFIKNRQNTRDDLIALQNYVLKRYVHKKKQNRAS